VTAGFPRQLAGVRLIPVQAEEALGALAIVAVGIRLIAVGARPASLRLGMSLPTARYAFCLSSLAGSWRPHMLGFSQAQWTGLLLVFAVFLAGRTGVVPSHLQYGLVAAAMATIMLIIGVWRRIPRSDPTRLLIRGMFSRSLTPFM